MSDPAVYGIMGYPIKKSLSRYMHDAAFDHLGINAIYLPFEVEPGQVENALNDWIATGVQGGNVTVPHKETVAHAIKHLEGEAATLQTVNTLVRSGDEFIGYTTDGQGLLRSLDEANASPTGKRIAMLGAGGAARSIAAALVKAGIDQLLIINRTESRAQDLADLVGAPAAVGKNSDIKSVDILINATSLGMNSEALPRELEDAVAEISDHLVVADIVYRPRNTGLLQAAQEKNAKTIDGLGMLLHQAALAFELWTNQKAPTEVMRSALLAASE